MGPVLCLKYIRTIYRYGLQKATKGITKDDRLVGYKVQQEWVTNYDGLWITKCDKSITDCERDYEK